MNKVSFNKENPVDLFSQLIKVLSREKNRGKINELIGQLRDISSNIFTELKEPKKESIMLTQNRAKKNSMKNLTKVVDDILKTAKKSLELTPGVTLNVNDINQGYLVEISGKFTHGNLSNLSIDEVIKKLQDCFKKITK